MSISTLQPSNVGQPWQQKLVFRCGEDEGRFEVDHLRGRSLKDHGHCSGLEATRSVLFEALVGSAVRELTVCFPASSNRSA